MSRAQEIDASLGEGGPAQDIPWGALAILFTAHFVVDGTVNFIAPLLPLIREQFQVSLSTGGLLLTFVSMSAALSQPVTAILVDRWPTLPWLAVGMVGSALFITSIGWAPNFTALTVMAAVGGSMVGLCHPDMASRAGALSENRKGLVVSVFIAGGRVGHGLGPVIAIGIVSLGGDMKWLWSFTLVAVAMALAVKYGLPEPQSPPGRGDKKASIWDFVTALRTAGTPLLLLSGVTICRAVVNINFISLIPSLYAEHGMSIWSGGAASAIMLTSGAVGVLAGGVLGDRFGKKELIVGGIGLGALCVCAFFDCAARVGLRAAGLPGRRHLPPDGGDDGLRTATHAPQPGSGQFHHARTLVVHREPFGLPDVRSRRVVRSGQRLLGAARLFHRRVRIRALPAESPLIRA